jgi:DNA polymerase V
MKTLPNRTIACLDLRSFYASCAAADLGLDVMEEAIAVIGDIEKKGSVVLAASPRMKKEFGVNFNALSPHDFRLETFHNH